MSELEFKAAAPRKLFIDELETARAEVRAQTETLGYTPTLKIMIAETELRARKLMENGESSAAKAFLERFQELEDKWGRKGMKSKMDPDECRDWLIAVEGFYIGIGLLEYEQEEGQWTDDHLKEFYRKLEK